MDQTARFFCFMTRREDLRVAKEAGGEWPWSTDTILNTYKFTNVKREHDRTTRWMRSNWTGPNEHRSGGEILFNCALFRYFGTSEFAQAVGWQQIFSPEMIIEISRDRRRRNERVFTGAYIIPTLGQNGPKAEAVVNLILTPLWERKDQLASVASTTRSWKKTADALRVLPGFGGTGFMAKEVLQDAIHTPVLCHATDRDTWCPAGPGARRGLNRIHGRPLAQLKPERHLVAEMVALLNLSRYELPPRMPALELHDIQFQLCEFDKYERVRLGEGRPKSRYRFDSGRSR